MALITRILVTVLTMLTITPVSTQASIPSAVVWPKDKSDMLVLPKYCRATQYFREFNKVTIDEIKPYYEIYGDMFNHLHHYCGALLAEYKANFILPKGKRFYYSEALSNLDYVLKKNPPASFPLLPEIYTTRGRLLLKLQRPAEAVAELEKVIFMKPDYEPAYIQLSDYYLSTGNKEKAISILEQGVENNPSPLRLLRRLENLGKPYQGTPGSAVAKNQETDPHPAEPIASETAPSKPKGISQPTPSDLSEGASGTGVHPPQPEPNTATPRAIGNPDNPNCRFCP